MRAFVVTMDALVAASFLFMAALLLYGQGFQPHGYRAVYLEQYTLDTLSVMEKAGWLANAIDGDGVGLRRLLHQTPDAMCMHISITGSNGTAVAGVGKEGCGEYGKELRVASRTVVHRGDAYLVKAESWFRRGLE